MDSELTTVWVDSVVEALAFKQRLLAWDSYECHIEDSITNSLKSKKIDHVIVPGGCTKYIQALDVSWNKPFKASCTEKYNEWLGTVGIHEETVAGNLKVPRGELFCSGFYMHGPSYQQMLSRILSEAAP